MESSFIPAEYYSTLYLVIVALFSIPSIRHFNIDQKRRADGQNAFIICTILVLFLGTRPISAVFADMPLYWGLYNRWSGPFSFDFDTQNILFDNLEYFLASIRFDPTLHYILFAGIYFGGILIACNKMFPNHVTFSFLCYCAAFSTFSYCVNGYKAGSAAALFLIAIAYRDNLKISIPFVLLSFGFHHSMRLPVVAYALTQVYSKPRYYYYLWYVCAIISILHITYFQNLFYGLADEHGKNYLNVSFIGEAWGGKTGFRFDFWLYSAMPVFVGWWTVNKIKIEDKFYNRILCMYILINSVWLLCIYAPFTNRISYLSWFMYPIVLIYPLFSEQMKGNRNTYIKYAASLQLAFTLLMHFIYYGN